MFEAIILAGGKGTRLKEITGDIPKPLVEMNDEPFLYKIIKKLKNFGCERVVLSLGFNANYIIESIENNIDKLQIEIDWIVEKIPLGTGGGIKLASTKVKQNSFIALNGDTITDLNISNFFSYSIKNKYDICIAATEVNNVGRYGSISFDFETNRLIEIQESFSNISGFINSGIYFINKKIIDNYDKSIFSFERDFIPKNISYCYIYPFKGYFIDIGIPEDYRKACLELK